jgi:phosphoglycolate phosphatase-like HAD superfamily hydrolase
MRRRREVKNANIFVDVDLTLIDAHGRMLPAAAEALTKLKDRGCHLFLWSTNGADYARATAQRLGLSDLFEGFAAKPDIIIDDMPGTVLNPFVFDVNSEASWPALAERIIHTHVD